MPLSRKATRICATLMVVWYAALCGQVLTLLIPDPANARIAESSQSYPCADHHCGCDTAAKCLAACCCYPKVAPPPSCGSCDEEPVPASTPVNTLSISSVLCLGLPDAPALTMPGLSKHTTIATPALTYPSASTRALAPDLSTYNSPDLSPPDKVPLQHHIAA